MKRIAWLAALPLIAADPASIARGKYLVEDIAQCQSCHTPKTASGDFDRSKWLKGAELDFQPVSPVAGWKIKAPDLTRSSKLWMRLGDGAMVDYLMTGLTAKKRPAAPPMPAYRFNRSDAESVLAYLKSLP
jgi:mono/diheme cytochrome c family protein